METLTTLTVWEAFVVGYLLTSGVLVAGYILRGIWYLCLPLPKGGDTWPR